MLVVTSNWCVSDGTLSADPPRRWVDRFRFEVCRSSLRYGFRRDGSYRPVDAIDVVLAGDTFDWLVSREWTGDVRPWDGDRRAAAALERVAVGALGRGARLMATLTAWMRRGIEVPLPDRHGRPMPTASRRVPVRVVALCGDRDRWLDRLAPGWAASRTGPVVGTCWSNDHFVVRHGAEMDPLQATDGLGHTLGASLAVDLIARFGRLLDGVAAIRPLAPGLVRRLAVGGVLEASKRLVEWLAVWGRGSTLTDTARQEVIDAWRLSLSLWHRSARRLPPYGDDGVDRVDRLAEWLDLDREGGHFEAGRSGPPGGHAAVFSQALEMAPSGGSTTILGHPPADMAAPAAWRRRVVCLGPRAVRAHACVEDESGTPAVAVVGPGCDGLQLEWLALQAIATLADDDEEGQGDRGIWRSRTACEPWAGRGIVDAA